MTKRLHSIKTKLTLLLLGTGALILLLVGIPMGSLVERFYQNQADADFERVFIELGEEVRQRESRLNSNLQRLVLRDDIISSLNMISQYARPEDYRAVIFDTEKRQLLNEVKKEILAGDIDEILFYNQQGRLMGFVTNLGEPLAGHLSYRDGESVYLLSRDELKNWQAGSPPLELGAPISQAQMQLSQRISYRQSPHGLLLQSSSPVLRHYPDGTHKTLGYIVAKSVIGESLLQQINIKIGVRAGLLFSSGLSLGNVVADLPELSNVVFSRGMGGRLPHIRIDHPDHYRAALRLYLDDGGYAHWIFSLPTAELQTAIQQTRLTIFLIFLLVIGPILFLALVLSNRVVSRPLEALSNAVEELGQGNYQTHIHVTGNDEFAQLSQAFNSMSLAIHERQTALQDSQAGYRTLVDNLPQRIYLKDRNAVYLSCNQSYADDLGMSVDDIVGKTDLELYPEGRARQIRLDDERVMDLGLIDEQENEYPIGDHQLLMHTIKIPISDDLGKVNGILCIFWDITEQKQAENRLRQSATVFENTADGVIVTDLNSRITAVNKAFTEITGYSEAEALGNKTSFRRSERQDKTFYEQMWRSIKSNGRWQGEIWNRRKSGEIYPEWMTISVVRDNNGDVTNYVAVFSDITQVKHSQMQIDHMANHDPLTDLPNRTLLDDRLKQAIFRAARQSSEISILFIDLDRFKNVNDTLGHPIGDKLLQEVARRLQALLRHQDTVARLGGDEFIILIEELDRPELAESVASKVIDAMSNPFHIDEKELFIGASIGISIYPEDGMDASTLIKHADAAMYRAKDEGRNTYQFYTRELTEHAAERLRLESALRRAMERNEFAVYYQPKIDLATGRLIGAEALIRWIHPEMGFISPEKFIPLAEENGQILAIGEWVLHESCRQLTQWLAKYPVFQHIAVNLSGVQIQRGDIVSRVRHCLEHYGLEPGQLHLEITESMLMQYPELAAQVLTDLRDMGILLAVDDFGTGYSSLSYLKRFPIHTLKIDRSFVMDIPHDSNDTAITQAIIAMGKSLQLDIVAEGVETQEQQQFLLHAGCNIGQGYYFSKPVPAAEFEKLLQQGVLPVPPETGKAK